MKKLLLFTIIFTIVFSANSQDMQLSQYYAVPTLLNPALAGAIKGAKVGVDYRNQWAGIGKGYRSSVAFGQFNFSDFNSGIGFTIVNQTEGTGKLKQNAIQAAYAYTINTKKMSFAFGLDGGMGIRSVDAGRLQFGDQFTNDGLTNATSLESINNTNRVYFDIGAGGLVFTDNLFIGLSTKHLNRANMSFFDGENDRIAILYSLQGGYKINLQKPTRGKPLPQKALVLTSQYRKQGRFNQFDIGSYFIYEPLLFGMWYRGLPIEKSNRSESLIFLIGTKYQEFSLAYSYDFALTPLRGLGSSVHEISLTYDFNLFEKNKLFQKKRPEYKYKRLPCTEFLK